ncbi:MAG: transcription termination factor NusA [Campylobacterales bacterium]|nr:transcription termination factor NusA [Campylobacterales bacterium]
MERILDIVDSLAHQRGLKGEEVRDVLKKAMVETAKSIVGREFKYETEIDDEEKKVNLFQKILVVADDDERLTDEEEEIRGSVISISEAKEEDEDAEIGDELSYEITLEEFGRTASMALHNNLERELQNVTESNIFEKYKEKIGKIISGTVTRIDGNDNTFIEFDEIRAMLPKKSRIKGENFRVGDTVKSIVKRVQMTRRDGIQIELSRTTPKFLIELLRLEVPEISDGSVIVEKAARIPGQRAKVAIYTTNADIDPVGATVGVRGVRINAVSDELQGENIDIINYTPIPELFLSRAMSPAIVGSVVCEDEKAIVTIDSEQKPRAIGKSGINIRLASMLTGFEIELNEITSSNSSISTEGEGSEQKEEEKEINTEALSSLFKD